MSWFEKLTGVKETSPHAVRQELSVDGDLMHSVANGKSWICGQLETPNLAELRGRVAPIETRDMRGLALREVVADVQKLHCDVDNAGAMFQVASQFNLLEMVSPSITPEQGVGRYERDPTQGPACAIAAGAGTIYRNYFVEIGDQIGQTAQRQIDCLADVGKLLGNEDSQLWQMVNGYALPTKNGLQQINSYLVSADADQMDELRSALRIGVHWQTQVTLAEQGPRVSQAYCSALPVAYTNWSDEQWEPFARLILEASYEATLCAAIENIVQHQSNLLYLTLLGGGAFGNREEWILGAIELAVDKYKAFELDVAIVSYGDSNARVRDLVQAWNN